MLPKNYKSQLNSYYRRGKGRLQKSEFGQSWRKFIPQKPNSSKYKGPFEGKTIVKEQAASYFTHFNSIPIIGGIKVCYFVENQDEYNELNDKIQEMTEDQKLLVDAQRITEANILFNKINHLRSQISDLKPSLIRGRFRVISYSKQFNYFLTELKPV